MASGHMLNYGGSPAQGFCKMLLLNSQDNSWPLCHLSAQSVQEFQVLPLVVPRGKGKFWSHRLFA